MRIARPVNPLSLPELETLRISLDAPHAVAPTASGRPWAACVDSLEGRRWAITGDSVWLAPTRYHAPGRGWHALPGSEQRQPVAISRAWIREAAVFEVTRAGVGRAMVGGIAVIALAVIGLAVVASSAGAGH